MTTVKQLCLGVAVAGAVVGGGSVAGTAIAYADDTSTDTQSSAADRPAAADKPSRKSFGPARHAKRDADAGTSRAGASEGGTADKPRMKVRADVPKLSQRFAAAVEAARGSKDRDIDNPLRDAGEKFSRTLESITDVPTNLRRSVEVRIADAEASRPLVQRKTALAVTDFLASVPKLPAPKAPAPPPLLPLTLAGATPAVNSTTRQTASAAQTSTATTQHVLVIGVDGVNLSKVLDDPVTNDNFIALMNDGTTSASSIAGHTTISNPSWTAILTGVWDNKSGVINNIFTARTYNTWPTVFDQLEGVDPAIRTTVIADWDVITDIADAGQFGADKVILVNQIEGDTDWSQTDAEVTAETIDSILGSSTDPQYGAPNFTFTYLVQVDEAGHAHGGDSDEYADALARTDENLGLILQAVADREAASCNAGACEEWTVIVVTDHGHQPQQGFGHGFQSPRETSAFVIAKGPGYEAGEMNLGYEIVDVTPTVVRAFGIDPTRDADGVPLQDQGGTQVDPDDLQQALKAQIASYGWPDATTTLVLGVRTVFASIPYYVVTFTMDITDALEGIADQDIFLVSPLAAVAVIPVQLIGGGLYAVTDVVAQIVGRLTGAGAIPPSDAPTVLSIFTPEPAAIAV